MYMKYCFESIRYRRNTCNIQSRNTQKVSNRRLVSVQVFPYSTFIKLKDILYNRVCAVKKEANTFGRKNRAHLLDIVSIISRATAWCYFSLTVSRRFKPRGREEAVVEATIETFAPLFRRNLLEDILRSPENIFRGGNGS